MKNYREEASKILELSKKVIDVKKQLEVYHYFDNGEEELSIDILVAFLNKEKYIPYQLGSLLWLFFSNFPADDIYVQSTPVNELIDKIQRSKLIQNYISNSEIKTWLDKAKTYLDIK